MDKIIQLLGTPTTKIWPAMNELPALKSFDLKPQPFNNIKVWNMNSDGLRVH